MNACLKLSPVGDCSTGLYGPIREWDVSKVTEMSAIFAVFYSGAKHFNEDLSEWNVAQVTGMQEMFGSVRVFNQDLPEWNVGKFTDMQVVQGSLTKICLSGT